MRERLRRLEWVYERTPIYFVTACTDQRRAILADPHVHDELLAFGRTGPERGAWLGSYVLMPDHIHAFVALDHEQITLADWMKSLKNALSKSLRNQRIKAPHWQKGFFDHVLRSGESYEGKWWYVRENPVRAGFVRQWKDWPYLGEIFDLEFRRDRI
jgi:putative transposase